jgi:colanic acid/amylovoran biosynthesis glycosyltransferase
MKIAYLLSRFPTLSETFVIEELNELTKYRKIEIFSLKKPSENCHKMAERWQNKIKYVSFFSFKLLFAQLYYFNKGYSRLLLGLILTHYISPYQLLKNLVIFPKSVYYAYLCKMMDITHIHVHTASIPATSAIIISKLVKIPYSITAHGSDIFIHPPVDMKDRIENSKFYVTISQFNKNYLVDKYKVSNNAIKVIKCGLPFAEFKPKKINHSLFTILIVARLHKVKNIDTLMKACTVLKDEGVAFRCLVVGSGTEEMKLKKLVSRLHLTDVVSFIGPVLREHIMEYYNKADVFVLPSLSEGLPVTIMEAMAMKVPVVASDITGMTELVKNNKTGLLFKTYDYKMLADCILKIKDNGALRTRLIKNAYMLVKKNHNIKINVKQISELFSSEGKLK